MTTMVHSVDGINNEEKLHCCDDADEDENDADELIGLLILASCSFVLLSFYKKATCNLIFFFGCIPRTVLNTSKEGRKTK